ncbi:MAG: stage II sporulation protein M [Cellvibrionaceae bacterium]
MKQQDFVLANEAQWLELETLLNAVERKPRQAKDYAALPSAYRHVCHHLALAKHRRYSLHLIDRLNRIVVGCHNLLYSDNARFRYRWLRFFMVDFPRALHRNRVYVRWATFLFCAPALVVGLLCFFNPDMVYSVMAGEQVRSLEAMYDPDARVLGRERESDTDLAMFGFYIYNNIGIAFREFAGGIFFGIGTLFFVIYNGIFLGAVFGHLTQMGYSSTLYPFVIGHGAFELTALVLAGAAGLKVGAALVDPGRLTRLAALRAASRDVVPIVLGATAMLLIAAFLEAFWSSKASLPIAVKVAVGFVFWIMVLGYLTFVGRHYRHGP